MQALAEIAPRGQFAVAQLEEILSDPVQANLHVAAAFALAKNVPGHQRATAYLVEAAALYRLGRLARSHLARVIRASRSDRDPDVRRFAELAAARIEKNALPMDPDADEWADRESFVCGTPDDEIRLHKFVECQQRQGK